MSTVMTPFGRWVVFVNLDKRSVIPLCFVLQLAHKLAPADITDRFGEMVVLHHILDLQTLDTHDLVLAYDGRRKLLLVVPASISDARVELGELASRLLLILGAFAFLSMPALSTCQLLLILGKEFQVAVGLPIRGDHHRLQAEVEPDLLVYRGPRRHLFFQQNGDEVALRAILGDRDRRGLGSLGQRTRPVNVERLGHLGKREVRAIPRERTARKGRRLWAVLFFDRRILGSAFKEVEKGAVQVAQGLLQGNRRDLSEPGVRLLLLKGGQTSREIIVGEPLTALRVGIAPLTQTPVVDDTAAPECALS